MRNIVWLVILGISSAVTAAAIPSSERAVLIDLYNSTNGPGWTYHPPSTGLFGADFKEWNEPPGTECTWVGVTCNVFGNGVVSVASIDLRNTRLIGTIPDLSGLTNLRQLDLSDNQLTGTMPDLSGLTNLEQLDLSNNELTGQIPNLTGLAHLQRLDLRRNQLSGSIPELAGLASLNYLDLSYNQLTGPVPDLSGLTNLNSLDLYGNQLTGQIPDLTGLTNLETFQLSSNQLTGTIPDLSGLTNLRGLYLQSNRLTGTIPGLTGLTNVQYLRLNNNQFTGPIPELKGLTNLQYLRLHNNQLTGSIPDLTGLTNLQYLYLHNNQFTGSIPDLTGLMNLQHLYLYNNQLTGSIPDLTGLTNLVRIRVRDNQLTGLISAAPPGLAAGESTLCPNDLTPTSDPLWDAATGVTPWSATCAAPPGPPAINAGGVVALNSSTNTIQPGAWISIYGTDLASTTCEWYGDFPTTLCGASVIINGKAGYLWYVSPSQINVQAPDDSSLGPVEVRVTTAAGTSTSMISLAQASPSFNLLDGTHIAGIIFRSDGSGAYGGGTYDIVGPTGSSIGYPTVAAKAGDTLWLYGVGFGPTDPPVPAGREFNGAATAVYPVQLMIGDQMVIPDWVGLAAAGLFQLNVTVPSGLGTGDQPIQALVNGISTPPGVALSMSTPAEP